MRFMILLVSIFLGWLAPEVAAMEPGSRPILADQAASPPAGVLPQAIRDVGFDQRIGQDLPLDHRLSNEQGEEVALGDVMDGRPVVLLPAYYGCPMLCPMTIAGLMRAVRVLAFDPSSEYQVIVYSFNEDDGPAEARVQRKDALKRYGHDGGREDIRFLTGSAAAIEALNAAIGLRVSRDAESGEFAHPSGVVVTTPTGKISRYLFGIEPSPRDLRLALVESSQERLGSIADQILLFCFSYDPDAGKYNRLTLLSMRGMAAATIGFMGCFIGGALWRERRRGRKGHRQ